MLRRSVRTSLPLLLAMTTAPLPAQGPRIDAAAPPAIVAHRGASHDAPENTLPAFALAFARGADAIEGDFYRTADGRVVCFHDRDTRRLTGVAGRTEDATLDALRRLDVGRWKAPEFTGTRMPTLAEVLELVPQGRRIFVECKSGPAIVPPLLDGLSASGLDAAQVTIIAFDAEVIAAVERAAPELDTQWLTGWKRDAAAPGGFRPSVDEVIATARRIGADGIDVQANLDVVDAAFVARIRAAGLALHCWTVNDPWVAQRLATLGVDSITTDRPAFVRDALRRPPLSSAIRFAHTGDPAAAAAAAGVFGAGFPAADEALEAGTPLTPTGSIAVWIRPDRWAPNTTVVRGDGWTVTVDERGELIARCARTGIVLAHRFHASADLGAWSHVALVFAAPADAHPGAATLYVDGRPADHAAWSSAAPAAAPRAWFGPAEPAAGGLLLDDAAILDRALDAAELAALMHRGLGWFGAGALR